MIIFWIRFTIDAFIKKTSELIKRTVSQINEGENLMLASTWNSNFIRFLRPSLTKNGVESDQRFSSEYDSFLSSHNI